MPNSSQETTVRQPKLQSYCALLYSHMLDNSTVEEGFTVWQGKITKTTEQLGIPTGTYKRIMDQLRAMKCIEQVERGFRSTAGTTVILLRPPTDEVWQDESVGKGLTDDLRPAILLKRIEALEGRLGQIDWIRALSELQQEIDNIKLDLNIVLQHVNQGE